MPTQLEILHTLMDLCNAHSVRVIMNSPRFMTVEVIIGRKAMENCAEFHIGKWNGEVRGIEKIFKTDSGYSETEDGLYRYTLLIEK